METSQTSTLKGTIARIRFTTDDGEWSVCDLDLADGLRPVRVVGNLLATQPGESVEVDGRWHTHETFGRQFQIETIRPVVPASAEGIEKYLGSGLIDGIGPVLASRIVDHFGEATLDVIDEDPTRIREVPGIGKVRAEKIGEAWGRQRTIRSVMIFLQSHGISPNFAMRIWRRYENRAIAVLRNDPYQLAQDVAGIGFKSADAIARKAGISRESLERRRAGVVYVLREAQSEGHCYLPRPELAARAAEMLELPVETIDEAIEDLRRREDVVVEPDPEGVRPEAVFRAPLHRVEQAAAAQLARLVDSERRFVPRSVDHHLQSIEEALGIRLAGAQRQAVRSAWTNKVCIITGGPGTGKTTITRAVCQLGDALGSRMALCAPTGRAAKRMSEATGRPAKTIHRLLEFSFKAGGFQFDEERPLNVDMLVVDEASMLDVFLLKALAAALPDHAALLLVGDIDQLPSVGPGHVLGDVIDSGRVEVVRLTEIFRQAQQSAIVTNAHRINRGEMPVTPKRAEGELLDFYTIACEEPAAAQERIVELVTGRIPDAFGFDPLDQVQVLSPMHKGETGCAALNARLQSCFHEGAETIERAGSTWRVGDKVMQTRNNYDLDVYNGDIGRIARITAEDKQLEVRFDDRVVPMSYDDLEDLTLAYAITVHKSQGSEYPAVVIPVTTQHYVLLQRNLLYTAVTRASKLVVLVGQPRAVELALKNDRAQLRYTRLAARLQEQQSRGLRPGALF